MPTAAAFPKLLVQLLVPALGLLLAGTAAASAAPERDDPFERPAMAHQVFRSKSVKPPAQQRERLLAAICGQENVTGPANDRHCANVPDYPSGDCSGLRIAAVNHGKFSRPGVQEIFLSYDGCEAHANNFGGGILLRWEDGIWHRILILPGERGDSCFSLYRAENQSALVCLNLSVGQGEEDASLTLLTFDGDAPPHREHLKETFNNHFLERDLCQGSRVGEPFSFQILEGWERLAATGDAPLRLRLQVRHEDFAVPPLCSLRANDPNETAMLQGFVAWRKQHARHEELTLEWCGDRFTAPGKHCPPER